MPRRWRGCEITLYAAASSRTHSDDDMSALLPSTTYCYASRGPASASPLAAAALGNLGQGNGGVCPVRIAFALPTTLSSTVPLNVSWTLSLNDQERVTTLAIVNSSTTLTPTSAMAPVQIAQSALYLCPTTALCGLYSAEARPLPYLPSQSPLNFTNGTASFFTRNVTLPAGEYAAFVVTTVPGLQLPNTSVRIDLVSYTLVHVVAPVEPPVLSTVEYVYIGVGAALAALVLVLLAVCLCRRRRRKLHAEQVMAAYARANTRVSNRRPSPRRMLSLRQSGRMSPRRVLSQRQSGRASSSHTYRHHGSVIRLGHSPRTQVPPNPTSMSISFSNESDFANFALSPWHHGQSDIYNRHSDSASSPADSTEGYYTEPSFASSSHGVTAYRI
ncbi:hypothetical protein SDRG_06076 [Saprolegnia diclina VS20]|uniref:Uncharacterized protein n=1 Tax=Saprolegnia diclina (strain VS20) TaxID=1156394 RepID=T0RVX5_SAPDV|nr:hypothetical protein SDRG_06076 [Saprolegnia diclina VS20]EQC36638.1 hypothetical protein SDRG_06076 [Saprolegnia diclina VS20]|eukprot:XP_008610059.1 hypothetical protein SDRG_06076 [Saprolegnia diclina VS20]